MRVSGSWNSGSGRLRPIWLWWLACAGVIVLVAAVGFARVHRWSPFRHPVVRIAYNEFPPYLDKGPGGTPVGFAAEMIIQAARNAAIDISWVEIHGSADKAFDEGRADLYPLMTITPERESQFHMSAPWWENQFALISTEGRAITDRESAKDKVIATRIGLIQTLSQKLYPEARWVNMFTIREMENALCEHKVDGFFSDMRLLQRQLLRRTKECAGQSLQVTSIPSSRLFLGTGSTKAAASVNDRLFREIAKLALDGTLSQAASNWGIYMPYNTAHLKQVVDAETRARLMGRVLLATLLILSLSLTQTVLIRRAKQRADSARAEAKEIHDWFDEFMRHTPTVAFIKDAQRRVVYSNEEFSCRGDVTKASDDGTQPTLPATALSRQLMRGDEEVLEMGRGVELMESLRSPDGANRHFLVLKFPFRSVAGAKFIGGVALDITARIKAEKELEIHATSDILTGLPNRRVFMLELSRALQACQNQGQPLAVGFVDLDGFKKVNDLLGHEVGDELLKQVAGRLRQGCREADIVARLGGDEFTFLLRAVSLIEAQQFMERVLIHLEEPFSIDGNQVEIAASIGVSVFPEHGRTSQELLRMADGAMYSAKRNGKSRVETWSDNAEAALAR